MTEGDNKGQVGTRERAGLGVAGGRLRPREERKGGPAGAGRTLTPRPCPPRGPGEPHVAIKAYTAEMEDEVSLQEGETIDVIHKLLDGWWVIR